MSDDVFDWPEFDWEEIFEALNEVREEPCSVCGDTGDTLPCITCDKLVCGECGIGVRWCADHAQEAKGIEQLPDTD